MVLDFIDEGLHKEAGCIIVGNSKRSWFFVSLICSDYKNGAAVLASVNCLMDSILSRADCGLLVEVMMDGFRQW
jgi:hypothetical protein